VTDDQREKRIGIIGAVKLLPAVKRKRVIKVLGKKKKKRLERSESRSKRKHLIPPFTKENSEGVSYNVC
jgi:hypothetical protein